MHNCSKMFLQNELLIKMNKNNYSGTELLLDTYIRECVPRIISRDSSKDHKLYFWWYENFMRIITSLYFPVALFNFITLSNVASFTWEQRSLLMVIYTTKKSHKNPFVFLEISRYSIAINCGCFFNKFIEPLGPFNYS